MTARWEYMLIEWTYSTAKEEDKERSWRQVFQIKRHGQEPDERVRWSSEKPDVMGPALLDLLHEVGAEGWELILESNPANRVFSSLHGWDQVGSPIFARWLLKRGLPDPSP